MMQNRQISRLNYVLHVILFHSIKFFLKTNTQTVYYAFYSTMHVRNTEILSLHGEIVFPKTLWNPYHFLYEIYNNYSAISHIKR